jgi:hypothetical protein
MKAIGGYFQLELNDFGEYHKSAIALNTARNSLEYIMRAKNYRKIYIPYYTCEVILEPVKKLNVEFEFYHIDKNFMPIIDTIDSSSALLYTNYFGICDKKVELVTRKFDNVIIDNAQSFYSLPVDSADTFYSCRKFFGVPDGAYLFTDKIINQVFETDISEYRISHLIRRIELGPEDGYSSFKLNDDSLNGQPIKIMSNLTKAFLNNIGYKKIKERRLANFLILHNEFRNVNELNIEIDTISCPMVYPLLLNQEDLRHKLIERKIYVAQYWQNVLQWLDNRGYESYLVNHLLPIPIDQRYNENIMCKLIEIIREIIK